MSNEAFPQTPWELWGQWNEMTARVWTNAIHNNKLAEMASPGVSHPWMDFASTIQKRATNNVEALHDPREAWKLWFSVTMDIWLGTIKMGGDPLGMITSWVKSVEHIQKRISAGELASLDPFALFNEWYNAVSKQWASNIEELIASEQLLAFAGPFLGSYSQLTSTFHEASEAYFKALRLPTLSDITHVAELIVSLEEKVDDVEETIEHIQMQTTQDAVPTAGIRDVEQRLSQIEARLDKMLTLIEKGDTAPTETASTVSLSNNEKQKMSKKAEGFRERTVGGALAG